MVDPNIFNHHHPPLKADVIINSIIVITASMLVGLFAGNLDDIILPA